MNCAKALKRHPERCDAQRFVAQCGCGKEFVRCGLHGGQHGANKSRGSHRAVALTGDIACQLKVPT